ncbi:hypothetical protein HII12_001827 [Brettanomyces bruxellensis]|uniref:Uncharacterized protein n=1 Tax=Dekkera bruxellensis TaxID=5007 RepID=A0A8H6BKA5_DEKBR|nr:hypothetical protein HII12_001827 [Brettanomyces bruxellensis]
MSATKVIQLLEHPDEFKAAVQLKFFRKQADVHPSSDSEKECLKMLKITSRSFAAVIMELDAELRKPIMIFYLVLRALDTIEDDMTVPNAVKLPTLESFHNNLKKTKWTFNGTDPKERQYYPHKI